MGLLIDAPLSGWAWEALPAPSLQVKQGHEPQCTIALPEEPICPPLGWLHVAPRHPSLQQSITVPGSTVYPRITPTWSHRMGLCLEIGFLQI